MHLNCIIDSCQACARTRKIMAKAQFRAEVAANMVDRILLIEAEGVDNEQEKFEEKTNEHDDLIVLFRELEEKCFTCMSYGGKFAMVAHEVAIHLRQRIKLRKDYEAEADGKQKAKAPTKSTRNKVVSLLTKVARPARPPGPYKGP